MKTLAKFSMLLMKRESLKIPSSYSPQITVDYPLQKVLLLVMPHFQKGKDGCMKGGTREPMLLRWPAKVAAGTKTDAVITSPDFYPTLA
jgi:hypothetical protein